MENNDEINRVIGIDIRAIRESAGMTLEGMADLFDEKKASMNKYENNTNQITLAKYLAVINFLREDCPDHPAHILIAAIGARNLKTMLPKDRPQVRLAGYLDMVDRLRKADPTSPALPLANYILYRKEDWKALALRA